ncbi:MAG: alpha-galactosidase [Spirochaetes bacterium]|nr:alpha-galactosidase [Spirochaetota bacterium]
MPIYFHEQDKEFHLTNDSMSYIFCILKNKHLGQIYYGKKLVERESFQHLIPFPPVTPGLTACVYENDPQFSLDLLKQEYPCFGTTDFRQPAFQILQSDGSRITNFEYQSHRIFKGKPELDGLPATYVERDKEANTVEITLLDTQINVELKLLYTIYEDFPVITRSCCFSNKGDTPVTLLRAMSASFDLPDADFQLLHLAGAWARERFIEKRPLKPGIQSIHSARGASSAHHNPFLALIRPETTEHHGEAYGFSLVYSGNFLGQVEVDHYQTCRLIFGINPFDWQWKLAKNQKFQTPELVTVYSDQGLNKMSQIFHQLYRTRLARGFWRDQNRPVLINNWEATYFDFDEDKILKIAQRAQEFGVKLFVLDDGWFGKRNDDKTSLGDWFVNKDKLPNGLDGLGNKVNQLDLAFGLWVEPEMISKNSHLYSKHPDWLIQVPQRQLSHGRNQFVLDLSQQEVVDYLYKTISDILQKAPITYVKWDMNRNMTEVGSLGATADRQQEVPHRYILGLYQLLEKLINQFPHILFESCASGGGRFDPGMLYYMPQTWASDDTDGVERLKIQYGTSLVYPLSSIGAHVSAVPNHQVNRITSINFRGNVAFFGCFGYELDLNTLNEKEKQVIVKQIQFYEKHQQLIQQGKFYRILSPFDSNEIAWLVVNQQQTQAIVGFYQILAQPNQRIKSLKLIGLNPDYQYQIENHPIQYLSGGELMYSGLPIQQRFTGTEAGGTGESGDFWSEVFILTRTK